MVPIHEKNKKVWREQARVALLVALWLMIFCFLNPFFDSPLRYALFFSSISWALLRVSLSKIFDAAHRYFGRNTFVSSWIKNNCLMSEDALKAKPDMSN